MLSGPGQETYANGNFYTGSYKNNLKHGHGTYVWTDGDIYVGEFKEMTVLLCAKTF